MVKTCRTIHMGPTVRSSARAYTMCGGEGDGSQAATHREKNQKLRSYGDAQTINIDGPATQLRNNIYIYIYRCVLLTQGAQCPTLQGRSARTVPARGIYHPNCYSSVRDASLRDSDTISSYYDELQVISSDFPCRLLR